MKYDINILLETWKGSNPNYNFTEFKTFQKCRKKKKSSRRYSGGIIILYKSNLHQGISLFDITPSENRIWMKLNKYFFGFRIDIFICVCYIPPVSSLYYEEDFSKLESEVSKVSAKGNVLIM